MLGDARPPAWRMSKSSARRPAPLALLRGRYRYRFLVNAKRSANLQAVLRDWIAAVQFAPGVRVGVTLIRIVCLRHQTYRRSLPPA